MDYDDNEFQGQNRQLASEGCSKAFPVLNPYALPKFDFDDSLNGHLTFNSLGENDTFLGITNQEDNQWIEQYSRGSSGIDFNSSTVESRRGNVWSEATSSESVEMLLKSVGQEEKAVQETIIENLDACNEPRNLTEVMDPNLNQESQKNQISSTESYSVVPSEKPNLCVSEEKVEKTFDDVIQKEGEHLVNEALVDNPGPAENVGASIETVNNQESLQLVSADASGLSKDVSLGSAEQSVLRKENSVSVESHTNNTEVSLSVENLSAETSSPLNEIPAPISETDDHESPRSITGSLTKISSVNCSSVENIEIGTGKDVQDVCLTEKADASLPMRSGDLDIEAVHALDNQKNVEQSLCVEKENTVIAYNFESSVPAQIEQVAVTESDKRSSHDTSDVHVNPDADDQPKSPIFGVSLVHQDNKGNVDGFPCEGNPQNEIPQDESVVASGVENPISLVEKEASPILDEKAVSGMDFHCATPVESCSASQIEQKPGSNNADQETGNSSQLDSLQGQEESIIIIKDRPSEINDKGKFEAAKEVSHDSSMPSKIIDDVGKEVQSVSPDKAMQEEKHFTFEVNKSAVLGQDGGSFSSYPTFQVSNLPKVIDGQTKDSSSGKSDGKKLHEVSGSSQKPGVLTSQIGVKGKSERKPRRKSAGKEVTKKSNHPKEITPARSLVRGEISAVSLTPLATGQVTHFEAVKSQENITKPGVAFSSPKLPDLNNSTSMFQQPFTDNQQVQLRAQILVYGSLISGSPPEESHMIAAFGQSDGGRTWEGVWRTCIERLRGQKSQPIHNTPTQPRSDLTNAGSRTEQGIKQPSLHTKIPSSPIVAAANQGTQPNIASMIPLSSPLWNIPAPSNSLLSTGMPKPARLDYHQPLSPLHPYQTTPVQNFSALNPSWLSQGPFAGQWVTASPIPTFNPTPRFPSLPINEPVKLTPVKELAMKHTSNPMTQSSVPTTFSEPSGDPKSRKRKKVTSSVLPTSQPAQNVEKVVIPEETLTKVEESKIQAEEANKHAVNAASQCHGVWSQLERQYNCGLNSDDEAKLVSSAVSIAAAASVAKVAAAAAKIASDLADQARSMATVFLSNKSQTADQSGHVNRFDKATTDAILKAAEMAAEAVSQAGKIVAMSEPVPLRDLIEAGPEGYWKTPQSASKQQALVAGNLKGTEKRVESTPEVSNKGNLISESGLSGKKNSENLAENQTMDVDDVSVPFTRHAKDKRKPRVRKGLEMPKSVGDVPEPEIGSITEGCLVEVYKNDDKGNGDWFGANVSSLKDGKALVSYTEIQSDEGQLKEWVPFVFEDTEVPKIRVAHPVTTMRLEGNRKRRRTASTDFVWSSGDRVDVWIQDRWREGVVIETNKIDVTSLTVKFPAQGETSVVRSWFVRPTLVWKDGKWLECDPSDKLLSAQGDSRQEKRLKLGSPVVENKRDDGSSENVDHVDLGKQDESRTLPLSTQESVFTVGSSRDNKRLATHRTMKDGLQKEGPRVVFGVPKPGKKQKFMEVSKHYVADVTNKNKIPHDSVKFTKYLIPQAPGSRGLKNNSRSDAKEKEAVETRTRIIRKPPIPTVRSLNFPKSTTRENNQISQTRADSGTDSENQLDQQNQMEIGSSSNIEDVPRYSESNSAEPQKGFSTKSERSNKRKFVPTGRKAAQVEKSLPEVVETRRSNRKIQPTSRLLEGLQSSITTSKTPAASHSTYRSPKVTPRGNTKNA
uniref:uncharacterized protein LOC122584881 isoform X2 n=1 Tax=Erigeron canadensis TaxID=72917 RepID=UPI001CB975FB|nr:uncharacterized protein LOC122584881 isoform X2 [Erigeron canadensis]